MSILKSLFGGSSQQQSSQDKIFGPQADFMKGTYYPFLSDLFSQYSQNPQDLIAGFNPTQQAGQNLGINTALGLQNNIGQANQALSQSLDPNTAFSSPLFQNVLQSQLNPYIRSFQNQLNPMAQNFGFQTNQLAQGFQNQLGQNLRNFTQQALPGIRSQAVGVGQVGGSREGIAQGMAGQALGDSVNQLTQGLTGAYGNLTSGLGSGFNNLTGGFMDSLGRITSEMGQNAFNQGINQRLSALGMAPQIGAYNFLPSQALQDIGGTQQAQQQRQLSAPLTFAQQIQALMGAPTVLGSSQGTNTQQGGIIPGVAGALSGVGDYLGGAGQFINASRGLF